MVSADADDPLNAAHAKGVVHRNIKPAREDEAREA